MLTKIKGWFIKSRAYKTIALESREFMNESCETSTKYRVCSNYYDAKGKYYSSDVLACFDNEKDAIEQYNYYVDRAKAYKAMEEHNRTAQSIILMQYKD